MPWQLSSQLQLVCSTPSQRQCEQTVFAFYCAVRERLAVWLLEDMRRMEVFSWDDEGPRSFSPAEALLYALVHDHQDYARFLLHRYSLSALNAPRCSFCCRCSSGAPHLSVAVRYNRISILGLMVEALMDSDAESFRRNYLDSCAGCIHSADAGKTAVQLAVELSRPDCLLLLLIHGATPHGLDAALQRLGSCCATDRRDVQRCLDLLLLFLPNPPALWRLRDEPQRWQSLLGKDMFSWLSGLAPPPLLLQAFRSLARSVPGQIRHLPNFLQPHSWQ